MADARTDFFDSGASDAPGEDARTAFFTNEEKSEEAGKPKEKKSRGWWDRAVGAGETALHFATGVPASMAGGLNYIGTLATTQDPQAAQDVQQSTQDRLTYSPRTDAGQEYSRAIGDVATLPDQFGERLGDRNMEATGSPAWSTVARMAPDVLTTILGARRAAGAAERPVPAPMDALTQGAMDSKQSMGAAASAANLTGVAPELQQAVRAAAGKSGGAVNQEALTRHIEASTLPVPIRLTEGQALQDPQLISQEMNNRGKFPQLANRYNEQNGQLVQNMQAIRDEIGPDVFSTNPVEHADTLIDAYKAKGAAADEEISANYQALKDANGGQFPVSAPHLLADATTALHKDLLYDHAPASIMKTLSRLAEENNMTFENFESLRTNLARIQRSATADGNEKAAAGIIRNAMESLPLQDEAADLKPLADKARASAKAQFDALKADPAYDAAVNEKVTPDKFVQKFIIGAPRDKVALMRQNLAHDPVATQTIGVSALDHLRKTSGIDSSGNGNFTQSGFNKNLEALGPKLGYLFDPKTSEQLQTLGNVARYTQFQPKGSYVNNSNTAVSMISEHGKGIIEGALNYAAHGAPVGTAARRFIGGKLDNKAVNKSLAPGAGISRLSDIANPK